MPAFITLSLTLGLGYAAVQDWFTRRLDYDLRLALFSVLIVAAGRHSVGWLAALALGIAVFSSINAIPTALRRALASLLLAVALSAGELAPVLLLMGLHWLAYENEWLGGADATLALGLLALFPTLPFVVCVLVSWASACAFSLAAKRWWPRSALAQSVPVVSALALAAGFYLWLWPLF